MSDEEPSTSPAAVAEASEDVTVEADVSASDRSISHSTDSSTKSQRELTLQRATGLLHESLERSRSVCETAASGSSSSNLSVATADRSVRGRRRQISTPGDSRGLSNSPGQILPPTEALRQMRIHDIERTFVEAGLESDGESMNRDEEVPPNERNDEKGKSDERERSGENSDGSNPNPSEGSVVADAPEAGLPSQASQRMNGETLDEDSASDMAADEPRERTRRPRRPRSGLSENADDATGDEAASSDGTVRRSTRVKKRQRPTPGPGRSPYVVAESDDEEEDNGDDDEALDPEVSVEEDEEAEPTAESLSKRYCLEEKGLAVKLLLAKGSPEVTRLAEKWAGLLQADDEQAREELFVFIASLCGVRSHHVRNTFSNPSSTEFSPDPRGIHLLINAKVSASGYMNGFSKSPELSTERARAKNHLFEFVSCLIKYHAEQLFGHRDLDNGAKVVVELIELLELMSCNTAPMVRACAVAFASTLAVELASTLKINQTLYQRRQEILRTSSSNRRSTSRAKSDDPESLSDTRMKALKDLCEDCSAALARISINVLGQRSRDTNHVVQLWALEAISRCLTLRLTPVASREMVMRIAESMCLTSKRKNSQLAVLVFRTMVCSVEGNHLLATEVTNHVKTYFRAGGHAMHRQTLIELLPLMEKIYTDPSEAELQELLGSSRTHFANVLISPDVELSKAFASFLAAIMDFRHIPDKEFPDVIMALIGHLKIPTKDLRAGFLAVMNAFLGIGEDRVRVYKLFLRRITIGVKSRAFSEREALGFAHAFEAAVFFAAGGKQVITDREAGSSGKKQGRKKSLKSGTTQVTYEIPVDDEDDDELPARRRELLTFLTRNLCRNYNWWSSEAEVDGFAPALFHIFQYANLINPRDWQTESDGDEVPDFQDLVELLHHALELMSQPGTPDYVSGILEAFMPAMHREDDQGFPAGTRLALSTIFHTKLAHVKEEIKNYMGVVEYTFEEFRKAGAENRLNPGTWRAMLKEISDVAENLDPMLNLVRCVSFVMYPRTEDLEKTDEDSVLNFFFQLGATLVKLFNNQLVRARMCHTVYYSLQIMSNLLLRLSKRVLTQTRGGEDDDDVSIKARREFLVERAYELRKIMLKFVKHTLPTLDDKLGEGQGDQAAGTDTEALAQQRQGMLNILANSVWIAIKMLPLTLIRLPGQTQESKAQHRSNAQKARYVIRAVLDRYIRVQAKDWAKFVETLLDSWLHLTAFHALDETDLSQIYARSDIILKKQNLCRILEKHCAEIARTPLGRTLHARSVVQAIWLKYDYFYELGQGDISRVTTISVSGNPRVVLAKFHNAVKQLLLCKMFARNLAERTASLVHLELLAMIRQMLDAKGEEHVQMIMSLFTVMSGHLAHVNRALALEVIDALDEYFPPPDEATASTVDKERYEPIAAYRQALENVSEDNGGSSEDEQENGHNDDDAVSVGAGSVSGASAVSRGTNDSRFGRTYSRTPSVASGRSGSSQQSVGSGRVGASSFRGPGPSTSRGSTPASRHSSRVVNRTVLSIRDFSDEEILNSFIIGSPASSVSSKRSSGTSVPEPLDVGDSREELEPIQEEGDDDIEMVEIDD